MGLEWCHYINAFYPSAAIIPPASSPPSCPSSSYSCSWPWLRALPSGPFAPPRTFLFLYLGEKVSFPCRLGKYFASALPRVITPIDFTLFRMRHHLELLIKTSFRAHAPQLPPGGPLPAAPGRFIEKNRNVNAVPRFARPIALAFFLRIPAVTLRIEFSTARIRCEREKEREKEN